MSNWWSGFGFGYLLAASVSTLICVTQSKKTGVAKNTEIACLRYELDQMRRRLSCSCPECVAVLDTFAACSVNATPGTGL